MAVETNIFNLIPRKDFPKELIEQIKQEVKEFDEYLEKIRYCRR